MRHAATCCRDAKVIFILRRASLGDVFAKERLEAPKMLQDGLAEGGQPPEQGRRELSLRCAGWGELPSPGESPRASSRAAGAGLRLAGNLPPETVFSAELQHPFPAAHRVPGLSGRSLRDSPQAPPASKEGAGRGDLLLLAPPTAIPALLMIFFFPLYTHRRGKYRVPGPK